MNLAILCLGHQGNPAGVQFLSKYFAKLPATIFLHIDTKADISPYQAACGDLANVEILADRRPILWGSFSIAGGVIGMIRDLPHRGQYSHFLYISEDTLPVVPASAFGDRLADGEEFLLSYSVAATGQARYDGFFYYASSATNPRSAPLQDRALTDTDIDAILRMGVLRKTGKAKLDLHGGPAWFGLSRPVFEKVIEKYSADTHLRESFEFSAIPEEHLIHTILAPHGTFKSRLVYDDFTRQPQPYVFRDPEELSGTDMQGAPFVRKIALDQPSLFAWAEQFLR